MIELNINEFHKVIPIFEGIDHNQAVLFSVIEGNNPGKVFIDDMNNPKTALTKALLYFHFQNAGEINWILYLLIKERYKSNAECLILN
jgi:hypothetical protein